MFCVRRFDKLYRLDTSYTQQSCEAMKIVLEIQFKQFWYDPDPVSQGLGRSM